MGGEKIVELVGDAGGQRADGLQPLVVGQLVGAAVEGLDGLILPPQQLQLPLGPLVPAEHPDDQRRWNRHAAHGHGAVGQQMGRTEQAVLPGGQAAVPETQGPQDHGR